MKVEATQAITKEILNRELEAHRCPLGPLPAEPLVSVLLINYNYAKYLPEALDSLLAQTYSNWEAILVDDGSKDNSREIMSRYAERDPRFKCVFKQNEGVPSALNDAYAQARGDIVALLDSDDAFLPGKIAWCVKAFLQNPDCGFAGHVMQMVDGRGALLNRVAEKFNSGWLAPEALANGGRADVPAASGLIFRSEIAKVLFPIPLSFRRGADSYLACVALLFTKCVSTLEPLAIYRQHGANITSVGSKKWPDRVLLGRMVEDLERTAKAQQDYIRKHLGLDASRALSIEDAWVYKVGIVACYVLNGKFPESCQTDISRVLQNSPSPGLYLILSSLLRFPRFITVPFVYAWLGEYPAKRMLYPLVRLFRLRQGM